MGFIEKMLPLAATAVNAITASPRRQYKWNKRAAEDTDARNRAFQAEQREYDAPKAQMSRYIEAGLNPHLIYGSGTSAGSAFPIQASRADAPNVAAQDVAGTYVRATQAQATMELQDAKTNESIMKSQAIELQNEIARTNPMLNPSVAAAVSLQMEEVARLKSTEAFLWSAADSEGKSMISRKVETEVEQMFQRTGLNTADLKIKNRILESKEFENAVKEVQASWLKDAEISPEHVRQGLMLILSKMLGR